ncbi:hypothetical protein [Paenibacillus hubeiensis]|uniref:hypothetical protein n=1 Tax=Paenibacillus hubeiensis TaxID=3077330 RepID=UPI0031BBACED
MNKWSGMKQACFGDNNRALRICNDGGKTLDGDKCYDIMMPAKKKTPRSEKLQRRFLHVWRRAGDQTSRRTVLAPIIRAIVWVRDEA